MIARRNGIRGQVFARDPQKDTYWAFVLGFFVWHHTLAVFQMDIRRSRETVWLLSRITDALDLPEFHKWQDIPPGVSPGTSFPTLQSMLLVLEGKYSESVVWTAATGYLTGLILASLIGQIEADDCGEDTDNLTLIRDLLVADFFAAGFSGYSEQLRQVLHDMSIQFDVSARRETAVNCRQMLEPIIKSLLLGQGEQRVASTWM
jgi:hypothetical protein